MTPRPPLPLYLFSVVYLGNGQAVHSDLCVSCMRHAHAAVDTAHIVGASKASNSSQYHGARITRMTRTDRLHGLQVG